MGAHFGHDFSRVRVHADPIAQESARSIHARAYTVGEHVVFGNGQYVPDTQSGQRLLAHELAHVVQQQGARTDLPLTIGPANDHLEHAADAASASFGSGAAISNRAMSGQLQRASIQREPEGAAPPAPASPAPAAPAPSIWDRIKSAAGSVYDSAKGTITDAAGAVISIGADFFMSAVKRLLPGVVDLINGIRKEGGIFNYLKSALSRALGGIFSKLRQGDGFVPKLIDTFAKLAGTAKVIVTALAHNDCKPLFDALGQLGDMLSDMAGAAWDKIKAFFAPIGDFFSDLWQKFGAPVVDFLTDYASDVWTSLKAIGNGIWDLFVKAKDALAAVFSPFWNWIKKELGIGDTPDSQDGLLQWAERKIGEAWTWVKQQVDPIIAPIKAVATKVLAFIPLEKILHLRETIHEWLQHVKTMVTSLQKPKGVTDEQASLRDKILPAVKARIVALGASIAGAGEWVAEGVGSLVTTVNGMLTSLSANSLIGKLTGAIQWVGDRVTQLGQWVSGGVIGLFNTAGQAVARLSGFVDPLYSVLEKVVGVIGNVVKELPGLVLGKFWNAIPACIRNPIKDFIIDHILSAIPIISTFVKAKDIWAKIQKLVMSFLETVFVKGDLGGAALMVIRFVLEAVGVDVNLFLQVLANAADAIDDVMMHPVEFLKNLFGAVKKGTGQFLGKIGSYLISGLLGWLLSSVEDLGVTAPKPPLTLSKLLDLVLQILGITATKLRKKVEDVLGKTATSAIEKAWGYISALISGGLGGLWEKIKGQLGDLWQSVIGGISQWVTVNLIEAGIEKLVELSNPAGAIIEAIRTIYKTVKFLVEKANKIIQLVDAVVKSIGSIAAGRIDAAADWIEGALARSVATLIGFFAEWLGFDDPGPQIREIVLKIQKQVDTAIDWVVAQGVAIAKGIAGALGLGEKPDTRTDAEKAADVDNAMNEADALCHADQVDAEKVQKQLPAIQKKYRLKELSLEPQGPGVYTLTGAASPKKTKTENVAAGFATKVTWPRGLGPYGGGVYMLAHPLTPTHEEGSAPGASWDVWEAIRPGNLKREKVGLYVRGHLLNNKLGGPGTEENLTPLTYTANALHEKMVESDLKTLVNDQKKMVHYEVTVGDPPPAAEAPAIAAFDPKTEGRVPAKIKYNWYELIADPSDAKNLIRGSEEHKDEVPNVGGSVGWPHA
jgi:hypothetical protein